MTADRPDFTIRISVDRADGVILRLEESIGGQVTRDAHRDQLRPRRAAAARRRSRSRSRPTRRSSTSPAPERRRPGRVAGLGPCGAGALPANRTRTAEPAIVTTIVASTAVNSSAEHRRPPRGRSRPGRSRTRPSGRARPRAGAGRAVEPGEPGQDPRHAATFATTTSADEQRDQRRGGGQAARVDQRPDGDEEQHGEHVAERQQPAAGLGRLGAVADREAGDERRQGRRHAEEHGARRGEREARRHRHDQEQVVLRAQPARGRTAAPAPRRPRGRRTRRAARARPGAAGRRTRRPRRSRCASATPVTSWSTLQPSRPSSVGLSVVRRRERVMLTTTTELDMATDSADQRGAERRHADRVQDGATRSRS